MPAAEVLAGQRATGVAASANGFQSSRPERKTMLRTVAIHHDGHVYTGRVRNISATGALIEGLWNVPLGTLFAIELADGQSVNATARWSKDDRIGVEFAGMIDIGALRAAPRALAS